MERKIKINNKIIHESLLARQSILADVQKLSVEVERIEKERSKLAIKMQKEKEKAGKETMKIMKTLDLTEFEEIARGEVVGDDTYFIVIDVLEDWKENYKKARAPK